MAERQKRTSLVVVTKKLGPTYTGATYATFELIRRWSEAGVPIRIFYMMMDEEGSRLPLEKTEFRSRKQLRQLVAEERDRAVFYSDDHLAGWLAGMAIPYIHTYHGNWPDARYLDWYHFLKSFYFIPLYRRGVAGACGVVNVSSYFQERFSRPLNNECRIIHNGINLRSSDSAEDSGKDKTEEVLMVGNIDGRKFSRALPLFRQCPDIRFHIYGKTSDPSLAEKISRFPNVTLMGFQSRIPYEQYRLFLSSSRMENLSIAVCEAVLAGVPVVGYQVGGLGEVIGGGSNGRLFPLRDEAELVKEIRRIARYGEDIPMDQSRIADFNWQTAADKYLEFIKEKGLEL